MRGVPCRQATGTWRFSAEPHIPTPHAFLLIGWPPEKASVFTLAPLWLPRPEPTSTSLSWIRGKSPVPERGTSTAPPGITTSNEENRHNSASRNFYGDSSSKQQQDIIGKSKGGLA